MIFESIIIHFLYTPSYSIYFRMVVDFGLPSQGLGLRASEVVVGRTVLELSNLRIASGIGYRNMYLCVYIYMCMHTYTYICV